MTIIFEELFDKFRNNHFYTFLTKDEIYLGRFKINTDFLSKRLGEYKEQNKIHLGVYDETFEKLEKAKMEGGKTAFTQTFLSTISLNQILANPAITYESKQDKNSDLYNAPTILKLHDVLNFEQKGRSRLKDFETPWTDKSYLKEMFDFMNVKYKETQSIDISKILYATHHGDFISNVLLSEFKNSEEYNYLVADQTNLFRVEGFTQKNPSGLDKSSFFPIVKSRTIYNKIMPNDFLPLQNTSNYSLVTRNEENPGLMITIKPHEVMTFRNLKSF